MCHKLELSVKSINSNSTKELAILKGEKPIVYVSRITGLAKGKLHAVINPRKATIVDSLISSVNGIDINPNKKVNSRYISSSNYREFDSLGYCKTLESNEPVAAGYIIDANHNLSMLQEFLTIAKENTY